MVRWRRSTVLRRACGAGTGQDLRYGSISSETTAIPITCLVRRILVLTTSEPDDILAARPRQYWNTRCDILVLLLLRELRRRLFVIEAAR